jgi:hypothetical protein
MSLHSMCKWKQRDWHSFAIGYLSCPKERDAVAKLQCVSCCNLLFVVHVSIGHW